MCVWGGGGETETDRQRVFQTRGRPLNFVGPYGLLEYVTQWK